MEKTVRIILSVLLAAAICLPLAACAGKNRQPDKTALPDVTSAPATRPAPEPTATPRNELTASEAEILQLYGDALIKDAALADTKIESENTLDYVISVLGSEEKHSNKQKTTQIIQGRTSASPLFKYTVDTNGAKANDAVWVDDTALENADYVGIDYYVYYKRPGETKYTIYDRETEEGAPLAQTVFVDGIANFITHESFFVGATMRDGENGARIIELKASGDAANAVLCAQFGPFFDQIGATEDDLYFQDLHGTITIDRDGYIVDAEFYYDFEVNANIMGYSATYKFVSGNKFRLVAPGTEHVVNVPENVYYPPGFVGRELDEELYDFYKTALEKTATLDDIHYNLIKTEERRYDLDYYKIDSDSRLEWNLFVHDRNGGEMALYLSGTETDGTGERYFEYYADNDFCYVPYASGDKFAATERNSEFAAALDGYLEPEHDFGTLYPGDVFRGAKFKQYDWNDAGRYWITAYPRRDAVGYIFGDLIDGIIAELTEEYEAEDLTYTVSNVSLTYSINLDGYLSSTSRHIMLAFTWEHNGLTMTLDVDYAVYAESIDIGAPVEVTLPE